MQALYHSPFLQALGYAIANSFWQVALIWLIVTVLHGVFKMPAAVKYRIAVWAQFTGFAWFAVTLRFYFLRCLVAAREVEAFQLPDNTDYYIQHTNAGFRNLVAGWLLKAEQLLPFLSVAYLFLLVFLAFKWAVSYRQAQHIRHRGLQKTDVDWRLFVQRIAAQLGIKSKVAIYLSTFVKSPLTVGFLKPVILIPVASINHLTTEQMEAVILHELAHIRRADYLVNLLQTVAEIVLFFNPFTRLLSSVIRKERENSCDDWVLQYQYNPAMYAEALLNIAWLQQQPVLAMPAAGDKAELLPRVKRMLNKQEKSFDYKRHLVALMLMTFLLSGAALLAPSGKTGGSMAANNTGTVRKVQPVVIEPVSMAVNNPLFSPVFFLADERKKETGDKKRDTIKIVRLQLAVSQREPAVKDATTSADADTTKAILQLAAAPAEPQRITIVPAAEQNAGAEMPVITRAVVTYSDKHIVVTGRKGNVFHQRHIQFSPVFAAFAPAPPSRVRPPRLPEPEDSLRHIAGFRVPGQPRLLMLQPIETQRSASPTAAMVLERFLQSGNDSLNQQILVTIARAKNNTDSVNVLRRFYRELWQQSRKRREQAEAAYGMQDRNHWAVFKPLVVEQINKSADSVTTLVAGKEGHRQYRIIITTSVTLVKQDGSDKKTAEESALALEEKPATVKIETEHD